MGAFLHAIMVPLYYLISGVLIVWHKVFSFVPSEGWAWALAVLGLTVTMRSAMIPLFTRQLHSMRGMQVIQPHMKAVQEKYKHDRERQSQEMMKLYKEHGVNPFASCLPMLVMMPVFIALFRVLHNAAGDHGTGWLSTSDATNFAHAHWLGTTLQATILKPVGTSAVLGVILLAIMAGTQFYQMHLMQKRNMPPSALTGPQAQTQKIMMYVMPVGITLFSLSFQVGLMIYWAASNTWTLAQQVVMLRVSPTPGSPAAIDKEKRDREKAVLKGAADGTAVANGEVAVEAARPAQRAQPKRQTKAQRQSGNKTPKKKDD